MKRKRKESKKAYNFDYKRERKIYKKIGNRNKGFLRYSDWEKHIIELLPQERIDLENFYHYILALYRSEERSVDICKTIATPVYMGAIALSSGFYNTLYAGNDAMLIGMFGFYAIATMIILISLLHNAYSWQRNKEFYGDCLAIIEEQKGVNK